VTIGFRLATVSLTVLLLGGCIGFLPIPTGKHTPSKYGTRGEIQSRTLARLGPESSRTDVLLLLGEPDLAWDDERYFCYRWITVRGHVVAWAVDDTSADGGEWGMGKRRHDLVFAFDDAGRIDRYADIRRWMHGSRRGKTRTASASRSVMIVLESAGEDAPPSQRRLQLSNGLLEVLGRQGRVVATRIPAARIVKVSYGSKRDNDWRSGRFRVRLRYRDGDRGDELDFRLSLQDLVTVLEWVAANGSGVAVGT